MANRVFKVGTLKFMIFCKSIRMRLILCLMLIVFSQTLRAETIVVCESCEVRTIKEGISLAADFDTLLIKQGTYREFNIEIHKPLTIIGENAPVIDGEKQGAIITIFSDNVTLDGLHIINRSEEHTSELQSRENLVCRLLLEKKNK